MEHMDAWRSTSSQPLQAGTPFCSFLAEQLGSHSALQFRPLPYGRESWSGTEELRGAMLIHIASHIPPQTVHPICLLQHPGDTAGPCYH